MTTTHASSSRASSSASLVADLLARWPDGVDIVLASRIDRHELSTRRPLVIVRDAEIPWSVLEARYPSDVIATARADTTADALELPARDALADLATVGAVARIAERLRAENGCPWDREQTHASLRPLLLEEAYEALDALDRGDLPALREELGDLLFHVVLHSQLASESGAFDLGAVSRAVAEKLIRRHPHVFAGSEIAGGDLLLQWEKIKRAEKAGASEEGNMSMLSGLPTSLPSLYATQRMLDRTSRVGLTPERIDLPLDVDDPAQLGDLLFDLSALARERGWDAETALRDANARFAERVKRIEALGKPIESYGADELRDLWRAHG